MSNKLKRNDAFKKCTKCSTKKTIDNFTKSATTKDRLRNWCKECFKQYDIERRKTLSKEYIKGRSLVRYWPESTPALAYNKYIKLLKAQDNVCKICNKEQLIKSKALNVDHCHLTGVVRGILCDNCNRGLGDFHDNTELLKKAINYLEVSNEEI